MRNPNQDLANLTGKTVSGLNVGRLASKYAPVANARRAQDLANERELELGWGHLEALRKKVSEELEKASEEMASDMPIASTFDALQEVKTHKDVCKDAGLRALMGHLEKAWKRDREGSISAASLGELRKHYARTFPKSAVVGVLDKIAKTGYACLEMSKLAQIAEEIETQDDYDRLMVENGLNGKQPNQVKARKFVLGLVNRRAQFEEEGLEDALEGDVLDGPWGPAVYWHGLWRSHSPNVTHQEFLDYLNANEKEISLSEEDDRYELRNGGRRAQFEDEDEEFEDEEFEDEGPVEGDYVISDCGPLGSRTCVTEVGGKFYEEAGDEEDLYWLIKQKMEKDQFYPNVWYQDDHGGLQTRSINWDNVKEPVGNLIDKLKDDWFDGYFDDEIYGEFVKFDEEMAILYVGGDVDGGYTVEEFNSIEELNKAWSKLLKEHPEEGREASRGKKRAGFMQPVIYKGEFVTVDTPSGGSSFDLSDVSLDDVEALKVEIDENGEASAEGTSIEDYVEDTRLYSIEIEKGWAAYMSAPGYMDRTELTVFPSREEAEAYLKENYEDEDEEFEDDDEEFEEV